MKELNHRHKIFCYKYLETQNATEAYLQAGYKVSREVARRNGARLLTNADVLTFIIKTQQELAVEARVSIEQVIQQLTRIGFGNGIGDVVIVKDGHFVIREDAKFDGICLLSQKHFEGRKRKSKYFQIKAEDRIKALDLLSKILGFYSDSKNEKNPNSLAEATQRMLLSLGRLRNSKNVAVKKS